MNQSGGSTTDLQLHHNFRWLLCANHMEPVYGFLLRYLRRRLLDAEVRGEAQLAAMDEIVQWLPQVWQLINRLLEIHGGSDVTVGQLIICCWASLKKFLSFPCFDFLKWYRIAQVKLDNNCHCESE